MSAGVQDEKADMCTLAYNAPKDIAILDRVHDREILGTAIN